MDRPLKQKWQISCLTCHLRVELRGIEPLTFSMRTRRATNCAIAPDTEWKGYQDCTRETKPAALLAGSTR